MIFFFFVTQAAVAMLAQANSLLKMARQLISGQQIRKIPGGGMLRR